MASINDIGVPGQPLNTPPLTEWQKAVRDVLGSDTPLNARVKATNAVKTADTAGIASGGSSGFTASLTGLRVGQIVAAVITNAFIASGTTISYTQPAPTGLANLTTNPVPPITGSTAVTNQVVIALYTATAATVSMGYNMAHANSGAWTAKAQSSIALIAL